MIIDDTLVRRFEETQKDKDTATAIYNLLWQVAADIFLDLGCKKIHAE